MTKYNTKGIVVVTVCMKVVHNTESNLEKYFHYIEEAASQGARLIVFPEQSLQGYLWSMAGEISNEEMEYHYNNAEIVPGPSTERLLRAAVNHNIYIIFGMTESAKVADGAVLYNSAVLVGPEGLVGVYRKVHGPINELHVFNQGNNWPVFETGIGKIGMLICYDKMFPESTRELALQGADLMILSTAWPMVTEDHDTDWFGNLYQLLDRVRAMENQAWFISSNQIGLCPKSGFRYYGHSQIVHPKGEVITSTGHKEGLAVAEIDVKGEIRKVRTSGLLQLNLIKDRKPQTYKCIADESIYYPANRYHLSDGVRFIEEMKKGKELDKSLITA